MKIRVHLWFPFFSFIATAGLRGSPPLGVQFQSPSGVGLVLFGQEACAYSFLDQPVRVQFGTEAVDLPAHGLAWLK
jgi:hypothetical protein